jgi:hypothetical protein
VIRRVAIGALVAGVVLVPATMASASRHPAVKHPLALVPLRKADLGAAGKGLALDYGSGGKYISNIGLKAFDVRPYMEDSGYQLTGLRQYTLDYGDPFTGSTGVMEVRTSVEQSKTPAAAKKGYQSWRYVDTGLRSFNPGGAWTKIHVPTVGTRTFAYLGTWAAPYLSPIVGLDEQVLAGRYRLELTIFAGSVDAAESAAPGLARKLHHRLQSMLRGHLTGKGVKLPQKPTAGKAADEPDPSTMILQPSDVDQVNTPDVQKQYRALPPALSVYGMQMQPAGLYEYLSQEIFWWPTATEATYAEAYLRASLARAVGTGDQVDLSAVGDNAIGSIFDFGDEGTVALIWLTNGQATDEIAGSTGGADPAPTDTDVQNLAQAAANRFDAGLGP